MISFFLDEGEKALLRERYTGGGLKYSEAKTELFQRIWEYYCEVRRKRGQLSKEPELVREILRAGAAKARSKALPIQLLVRERAGLAD